MAVLLFSGETSSIAANMPTYHLPVVLHACYCSKPIGHLLLALNEIDK